MKKMNIWKLVALVTVIFFLVMSLLPAGMGLFSGR